MNPPLANKSFIWNVLRRGSLLARPLRKQSARFLFGLVLTWRQGNTHSQGRPMPMVELLVFLIGILLIATPHHRAHPSGEVQQGSLGAKSA